GKVSHFIIRLTPVLKRTCRPEVGWGARRSAGDASEGQPDDPGHDQPDGNDLERGRRLVEYHTPDRGGTDRADASPRRVRGADLEPAQSEGQQAEADQRAYRESRSRPQPGKAVTLLQQDGESGLEQPGSHNKEPSHEPTPAQPSPYSRSPAMNPRA